MPTERHMPAFNKPSAALVDRFAATMAAYPEAPVRNTFGSPCAYVNGNMAVGLHASGWFVRLDPVASADLAAAGGEPFSPMPGRPMTGYTVLPQSILDDEEELRAWVERALAYTGSLPLKNPGRKTVA